MASRTSRSPDPAASSTRKPAQAASPAESKAGKRSSRATAKAAAPRTATPEPGLVTEETPVAGSSELTKKELIESVLERSDVKKKFAKPVVEAMIEVIGDAIATGREINLQPMGKIKPQRTKDSAKARVVIAKIRQNKPAAPQDGSAGGGAAENSKQTLADEAE